MPDTFPTSIRQLPEADVPLEGVNAYLSQGDNHQIVFMEFTKDVELSEHSHNSQWEIVLEGKVELWMNGIKQIFTKGDRFFIPNEVIHSARVYAGYVSIVFFNQRNRYKKK